MQCYEVLPYLDLFKWIKPIYLYHLTYDNITYATLYSPRMRRSNYQPWQTADSRRDIGDRE